MKNVLVLCTGNSCRSVMAEALINHLGAGAYKAVSAGSKPAGYVHPKSLEALKRHGIEAGAPRSKSWDEFEGQNFDLVITVCDAAASEACPVFFGQHKKLHWPTPDPAAATGSEEDIDAAFDEAFLMLRDRVERELLGIQFSANDCFKPFTQSFNRVKYFSCMINNLDVSHFPEDWHIQNKNGLSYAVEAPKTREEEERILDGLKHFMQCYLVRDCIESFALSLDKLFFLLLISGKKIFPQQTLYDILSEEEKALLKDFEKAGISSEKGKIQLLKDRFCFDLPEDQKKIITGLKDIRNCFAHGNGFVRRADGKKDGKHHRKFTWKTIHIFTKGIESGQECEIKFNEPLPEAVNVCMQIKDHVRTFRIGEQMTFSPVETYEIALSLQFIAQSYLQEMKTKNG